MALEEATHRELNSDRAPDMAVLNKEHRQNRAGTVKVHGTSSGESKLDRTVNREMRMEPPRVDQLSATEPHRGTEKMEKRAGARSSVSSRGSPDRKIRSGGRAEELF